MKIALEFTRWGLNKYSVSSLFIQVQHQQPVYTSTVSAACLHKYSISSLFTQVEYQQSLYTTTVSAACLHK